jgi:hypothetical protein
VPSTPAGAQSGQRRGTRSVGEVPDAIAFIAGLQEEALR